MSLKRKLLVLSMLLISGNYFAQTTTAFRTNYGVALMDIPANAIESQTSGNYIFAGMNVNFLPIVGTVTELNSDGTLNWSKSYSGGLSYQLNDIKKDGASGYYLCGGSSSSSGVFLRVDNSGNYVDGNKFDLTNATGEYFSRMVKTSDGGYVAAGYTYGYDPDGAGGVPRNDSTSALVVKFDAGGNVLWHHVFRFYSDAGKTNPILNDGAFADVVEVSDGYIFVGSYEVDDVININSDGDDMTPNDAMILKTTTGGAITFFKQIDAPSTSSSQASRDFGSVSKTAAGLPLISGSDGTGRPTLLMRLPGSGGWSAPTWLQKFGATTFFGTYDPFVPSRFFETSDGNYAVMGMYIQPLNLTDGWRQYLMKINPSTYAPIFTKSYTFGMAVILPQGQQVSDNGFISVSTVMAGGGFDYHVIKTDPNGVAPTSCAEVNVTPSQNTPTYTWADPYYNDFNANTYDNSGITPTITPITPASSVQCLTVITPCTTPAAPTAAVASQPNCSTSTGSVTLTGLPSSGTWTVSGTPSGSASGSGTSTTITGLAAGNYTFTVTQSTCTSSASNSVTINAAPTVPTVPVIGTITQTNCSTSTGSIQLTGLPASGTWTVTGTPSGSATGTGTSTTLSGLAPGSYTFTVSNGTCTSASSTSATINPQPTTPAAPTAAVASQPNCSTSTGSVTLSGLPSSGTWTITGSPSGSATGTGTSTTISGLAAGSYTFTVNNGSCTSVSSSSVTINAAPTVPTAPVIGTITQTSCVSSTGSIQLNGLPSSGTWTVTGSPSGSATGTGTSTTISGLAAGSYTFTVSNGTCNSVSSLSATINPQPTTPATPTAAVATQPDCASSTGSVTLTGLPSSGTWTITGSPSGTATGTGTSTTISGLVAGSYTFNVGNGSCTSTSSNSVTLNAAPIVPTAPITGTVTQPTCSSPTGSVALSGLPSSGSWTVTASPGGQTTTGSGTTTTFNGLNPGSSYTFTVNNGTCTSAASSSVTINSVPGAPTAPVIGTVTQPTCSVSTGSVQLTGLPSSGTWTVTGTPSGSATGTGTSTTLTGLTAGTTYTFTVTNDLGCTSGSSTSAILNASPVTPSTPVMGAVTQPTCTTATGSVDFSGLPSSGTWTITSTPGGLTSTGTGATGSISGLSAGTSYTFTVTNSDGCTSGSTSSASINTQPSTPSAPVTGTVTQPTCSSPTGSVDLSGLPSGNWTLTASPGTMTANGNTSSTTFTGLAPGTSYTFTVTNASGCTSVASASVAINSVPGAPTAPTAGTVTQPTCSVPTGSIDVASPLGASYTYSIDGTTFQSGTTFSGLAPGNYTITVLDNTSGCSSVSASQVTINPVAGQPVITLTSSTNVTCNGDADGSLDVSVAGGSSPYTYSWSPNVGSGPSVSNLSGGSYDITVTDNLGCSSTETFTVNEPGVLAVNGIATNVNCGTNDGSISTSVSGGTSTYTYSWTPNGETTSSLSGLVGGSYGVTVTDANGCTATENYTIIIVGSLPIVIDPDYSEVTAGTVIQYNTTGGTTYTWTPSTGLSCSDCPNPSVTATQDITYYVTATDPNGCTGSDSTVIVLKLPCGELFVPTIFSPNGTGPQANNELCVFGTASCIKELLFQVYDRWGEKVFETTDISKCWNGKFKDKDMNSGIYVYRLYAELTTGEIIDVSGNSTLVR